MKIKAFGGFDLLSVKTGIYAGSAFIFIATAAPAWAQDEAAADQPEAMAALERGSSGRRQVFAGIVLG